MVFRTSVQVKVKLLTLMVHSLLMVKKLLLKLILLLSN